MTPSYCTQNRGDCSTCSLMIDDGFDCHGNLNLLDILEETEDILEPIDDDEPDHPPYCTQNGGDCSTCSLVNYGLDCQNNLVSDRGVKS